MRGVSRLPMNLWPSTWIVSLFCRPSSSRDSPVVAIYVRDSLRTGSRFSWDRAELRRRDAAFGSCFIGRGYLQNNVLLSWFGSEHQGERQAGRWQRCRRVVIGGNIALFVGAQDEDGIVDGAHISGRNKDLSNTGERTHTQFTTNVALRLGLRRQADLSGRQRIVEAHDRVKMVLQNNFHLHAAKKLAHHDVLVDALTLPEYVAEVIHLFPIFECGALIIPPELGARIER